MNAVFRKIKGVNCRHSRFEARNESPMMRKCEFRMQENPKLLQSKFERSETLGLGPKHSNLSLIRLNLAQIALSPPFRPIQAQAHAGLVGRGARLNDQAHA